MLLDTNSQAAKEFIIRYKIKTKEDLAKFTHHATRQHETFFTKEAKIPVEQKIGYRGGDSQETILLMEKLGLKHMKYGGATIPELHEVPGFKASDFVKVTDDIGGPSLYSRDIYLPSEPRNGAELQGHEVTRMNGFYFLDSSKLRHMEITKGELLFGDMGDSAETVKYMTKNGLLKWVPTTTANGQIPGIEVSYNSDSIYHHDINLDAEPRDGAKLQGHEVSRSPASYYKPANTEFEQKVGYSGESHETYEYMREHDLKHMRYGTPKIGGFKDVYKLGTSLLKKVLGIEPKHMNFLGKDALENLATRVHKRKDMSDKEKVAALKVVQRVVEQNIADEEQAALLKKVTNLQDKHNKAISNTKSPLTPEQNRKEDSPKAKRKLFESDEETSSKATTTSASAEILNTNSTSKTSQQITTDLDEELDYIVDPERTQEELDYIASAPDRRDGIVNNLRSIIVHKKSLQSDNGDFYDKAINFLLGKLVILSLNSEDKMGEGNDDIQAQTKKLDQELLALNLEEVLADTNNPLRPFHYGMESELELLSSSNEKSREVKALETITDSLLTYDQDEHLTLLQEGMNLYYNEDIILYEGDEKIVKEENLEQLCQEEISQLSLRFDELKSEKSEAALIVKLFLMGQISAYYDSISRNNLSFTEPNENFQEDLEEYSALTEDSPEQENSIKAGDNSVVSYLCGIIKAEAAIKQSISPKEKVQLDYEFIGQIIDELSALNGMLKEKSKNTDPSLDDAFNKKLEEGVVEFKKIKFEEQALYRKSNESLESETILGEMQTAESIITAQKKLYDDDESIDDSHLQASDEDDRENDSADSAAESDVESPKAYFKTQGNVFSFEIDLRTLNKANLKSREESYKPKIKPFDLCSNTSSEYSNASSDYSVVNHAHAYGKYNTYSEAMGSSDNIISDYTSTWC